MTIQLSGPYRPLPSEMCEEGLSYLRAMAAQHPRAIKEVDFSYRENVVNTALPILAQLPFLSRLNVAHPGKLNFGIFREFQTRHLTDLDISYCDSISQEGLRCLAQFKLVKLNLSGCFQVQDRHLELLAKTQPALRSLDLMGCSLSVSVVGLRALATLPLTSLKISLFGVTDAEVDELEKLPLTELVLVAGKVSESAQKRLAKYDSKNLGCRLPLVA